MVKLRWLLGAFLLWLVVFGISYEPRKGGSNYEIFLLDHGYHTGLYLPRDALENSPNPRAQLLALRYPNEAFLEFGWGDREFYMVMGGMENFKLTTGMRAFFWPTPAVMQVVPTSEFYKTETEAERRVIIPLGREDMNKLIDRAMMGFASMDPIAPSRYGDGHFYQGAGTYSLFQTCNHWVASVLRSGGIASSYALSFHSWTQMRELKWRYEEANLTK